MKLTILGSGDCSGTPQLGCQCRICKFARKNGLPYTRTRFSILLETDYNVNNKIEKKYILIDTSPDLRYQLLRSGIEQIDAILFTHGDYDHTSGIFELYRTHSNNMYRNRDPVQIYGGKDVLYHVIEKEQLSKVLNLESHEMELYGEIDLFGLKIQSFEVNHSNRKKVACRGYKITTNNNKNIIISGDTGLKIPEKTMKIWKDAKPDLLLLEMFTNRNVDFLKGKHLVLSEVEEVLGEINSKKTVLVHISHLLSVKVDLMNEKLKKIDQDLELGYDGMVFSF